MLVVLVQVASFCSALEHQVQETVVKWLLERGNQLEDEEEAFISMLGVVRAGQVEC